MSQYIGKTISLISNKGLRYVGLLDNINANDATVALKSVRLFGTEGRMAAMGQAHLEVPPGVDVYEYVVFRGSDVKDLSVLDTPIDEVKPDVYQPPQQQQQQSPTTAQYYSGPTPTSTTNNNNNTSGSPQAPPATTTTTSQSPQVETRTNAAPAAAPSQPVQTSAPEEQQQEQPTKTVNEEPPTKTVSDERAPQPRSSPSRKPSSGLREKISIPTEEFDFEQANAKFSKELEQERELEHTGYNKSSSFFDNISSSTEERTNMRWAEEKNLNMDTFGEASLQRGRGRGRGGRGGRGNWRGRGGNRGGRGNWRGGNNNRGRNSDYNTKPEWA
ncbi:SCD6 Protein SCD6 [Candida maltosa Xu316]